MQRHSDSKRRTIISAVVTHYEKRTKPTKHYVFAIKVTWSDDERLEVYRQYSDFFSFHEMLPESVKSIVSLPVRIIFGRSNISSVAEARLDGINKYCQILMNMHPSISQTVQVWKFFSHRNGDKILPKINLHYNPSLHPQGIQGGNMLMDEHQVVDNYTAEDHTQLSVKTGDVVMVMIKNASGWYMCQNNGKNGWVPGSYLVPKSSLGSFNPTDVLGFAGDNHNSTGEKDQEMEIDAETYRAIDSYEAQGPGQVSFKAGELITVLDKMEDGWWFVSKEKTEEWAPSSYLEPSSGFDPQNSIPTQGDESDACSYMATEGYTAENEDEVTFPKNAVLTVTWRSMDGWWKATYNGHTGLVPSSHLAPFEGQQDDAAVIHQEELALKQRYKQPPRRKTILKSLRKVDRIPVGAQSPLPEESRAISPPSDIFRARSPLPDAHKSRAKSRLPDNPRARRLSSALPDEHRASSPTLDQSSARLLLPDTSRSNSALHAETSWARSSSTLPDKSRARRLSSALPDEHRASSPMLDQPSAKSLLPDISRTRLSSTLPDTSRAMSPQPDQYRARSPSLCQQPDLEVTITPNTADMTSINTDAPENAQTGSELPRQHQLQLSRPYLQSGHITSPESVLDLDTSNASPQQKPQDETAPEYSKELCNLLSSQGADYAPRYPSSAGHKSPSSEIDITLIPSSVTPSPPATDDSIPLLPQTNLTTSEKDTVVDPDMNIQQVAGFIVKFVLASDDPELRAALKRIVNNDPNISRRL